MRAEGMDRFSLRERIYDLFFENASKNDKCAPGMAQNSVVKVHYGLS